MIEAREIEVGRLRAHGENANVMSKAAMAALKRNIERSGRYPALIVRPIVEEGGGEHEGGKGGDSDGQSNGAFELLDGHHRLAVLKALGYGRVRCEVWTGVDDDEARLLLATLNRLEGADDPVKRGRLLAQLLASRGEARLRGLLPDSKDRIERLLSLGREDRPSVRMLDRRSGEGEDGEASAEESANGAGGRVRALTLFVPADALGAVRRGLKAIDADPGRALCMALGIENTDAGEGEAG